MPGWFWDKYTIKSPSRLSFVDFYTLGNVRCAEMEMDFLRCADRVGLMNTKEKCPIILDDYKECMYRHLSDTRFRAIRTELVKQKRKPISFVDDMRIDE